MFGRYAFPFRVPEVRCLAIDRVFRRTIFPGAFFAIHVSDRPAVVADGIAARVEQIQFCDGGKSFAIEGVQGFQRKEFTRGGRGEFDLLSVAACRKRTGVNRRSAIQFQRHRRAMSFGKIFFRTQLIQNRFRQSGDFCFLRSVVIQNHDFIFTSAQPAARQVSGLRRADIPEPREAVAIHPHHAFAPRAQVEKRIASLGEFKAAAPESGFVGGLFFEFQTREHFVVERKIENFPAG